MSFMDHNSRSLTRGVVPDRKDVAVGAGAKINQSLAKPIHESTNYADEPDAVMRIYFVFKDEFDQYARHGFVENQGMLKGIPVG